MASQLKVPFPGLCGLLPICRIPPDLDLQQVNDQFIMDNFFSLGQPSNSKLISINHCCLAKQVLTVADICSGDGTCIQCYSILPQVAPFSSNLIWQHEQPSLKDWHIWSQALHLAFGPQLIIAIPHELNYKTTNKGK